MYTVRDENGKIVATRKCKIRAERYALFAHRNLTIHDAKGRIVSSVSVVEPAHS